jgi:hypothetical protein
LVLRRRFSVLAASAAVATALLAIVPGGVSAAGRVPSNTVGADISWPQCGTPYPSGYNFAVVGVTRGRPFTGNPCFGSEFDWAQSTTGLTQLYLNLDYGQVADGALSCDSADTGCLAYNYGFGAARWAYQYAHDQTGGRSDQVAVWWLDVETQNTWSGDQDQNGYVIQGALDYLQRVVARPVGIYSTHYQWGRIAGSFAPPNVGQWVAGAGSLVDEDACADALWPGGQVWAIQYLNWNLNLDQDAGC